MLAKLCRSLELLNACVIFTDKVSDRWRENGKGIIFQEKNYFGSSFFAEEKAIW